MVDLKKQGTKGLFHSLPFSTQGTPPQGKLKGTQTADRIPHVIHLSMLNMDSGGGGGGGHLGQMWGI